jgi:hypothetical protein
MLHTTRLIAACAGAATAASASAQNITIQVRNVSPVNGTFVTPVWFGFHDGSFDLYDLGAPASPGLERMAEDGDLAALRADFMAANSAFRDTVAFGGSIPPIAPGETVTTSIMLPGTPGANRYVSYASMIIPSNDAFVANGNPLAFSIFDAMGNFTPVTFTVTGAMVRDAGTEVNDEVPANTAFFGQMAPNTGLTENGVVTTHPGFIPSGAILSTPMFSNADFTAQGYSVLEVTIIPAPAGGAASLICCLAALGRRRR